MHNRYIIVNQQILRIFIFHLNRGLIFGTDRYHSHYHISRL